MTWGHPKPRPSFSSPFPLNSFLSSSLPSSPFSVPFTSSIPSRRQHGLPSLKVFQKTNSEWLHNFQCRALESLMALQEEMHTLLPPNQHCILRAPRGADSKSWGSKGRCKLVLPTQKGHLGWMLRSRIQSGHATNHEVETLEGLCLKRKRDYCLS